MHWNSDWHMGWMGWIALWWLLIFVPVLIAATWFALSASRRNGIAQKSAKQALERRFANRELDRATYERMLGDLPG